MDTSITIAVIVAVLFAFTLPALLRRWDVAPAEPEDRHAVPATAVPVQVPAVRRPASARNCEGPATRVGVFDAHSVTPRLPELPSFATAAPALSLRRERAALSVITGDGEDAAARDSVDQDEASAAPLPLAAGQGPVDLSSLSTHAAARRADRTGSSRGSGMSRVAAAPGRGRQQAAAAQNSTRNPGNARGHRTSAPTTSTMDAAMNQNRNRPAAPRSTAAARVSSRTHPHTANRNRRDGRQGPHAESLSAQRSEAPAAGPKRAMRGLGLAFAAFGLFTVVTAAISLFGPLTWAVPVLSLALALGCLLVVVALNGLTVPAEAHEAEAHEADRGQAAPRPQRTDAEQSRRSSTPRRTQPEKASDQQSRTAAELSMVGERAAAHRREPVRQVVSVADAARRQVAEHEAKRASGADHATRQPAAARRSTVSRAALAASMAKAADARAAAARSAQEEAATGEIPVVTETAEQATETAEQVTRTAEQAEPQAKPQRTSHPAPELHLGPAVPVGVAHQESAAEAQAAQREAEAERAVDPLSKRLESTGWRPARVPAPTYTEVPEVPREAPEPVVADASSAGAPSTREALAERFAAELGYRPEMEDAARVDEARTDTALAHGRAALGTNRPPRADSTARAENRAESTVNDALARRRA